MNHDLEELEVPQPPYRMARPVARLAAVEEPSLKYTLAEKLHEAGVGATSEKESSGDLLELLVTSEKVDEAVDSGADEAVQQIKNIPVPAPMQAEAIQEVEKVVGKYRGKISPIVSVKATEQPVATVSGERGVPYYEELEKAASAKGDVAEAERLQKIIDSYKTALKPSVPEKQGQSGKQERKVLTTLEEELASLRSAKGEIPGVVFKERVEEYEKAIKQEKPGRERVKEKPAPTSWFEKSVKSGQDELMRSDVVQGLLAQVEAQKQEIKELRQKSAVQGEKKGTGPIDLDDAARREQSEQKQPPTSAEIAGRRKIALDAFLEKSREGATADPKGFEEAKKEFEEASEAWVKSLQKTSEPEKIEVNPDQTIYAKTSQGKEFLKSQKEAVRLADEELARRARQENQEPEQKEAGQAKKAMREVFEQMAPREKSSLELELISNGHNIARWWHSVLAKGSQDLLKKSESRIGTLESELAAFADKSWFHTAIAPLHYKRWMMLAFFRESRERSTASLNYHESERRRHESARAGYLDVVALSMDAARKAAEVRKAKYEKYIGDLDKRIAELYRVHQELTMKYGGMDDNMPEKRRVFAQQEALLKEITTLVSSKSKAQRMMNDQLAVAEYLLSEQNSCLDMRVLVTQPDTPPIKNRRRAQVGVTPKRTIEEVEEEKK